MINLITCYANLFCCKPFSAPAENNKVNKCELLLLIMWLQLIKSGWETKKLIGFELKEIGLSDKNVKAFKVHYTSWSLQTKFYYNNYRLIAPVR